MKKVALGAFVFLGFFGFSTLFLKAPTVVTSPNHTSSELGFKSLSPQGISGGASLPASCESGYAHDAGDCTISISASPSRVLKNSSGSVISWNFHNTVNSSSGYSYNGPGQAYYTVYNSPLFCNVYGGQFGGGTTYWYPSAVAGSVGTSPLSVNTTYGVWCRAAAGFGEGYYPQAGWYYDYYSGTVTVQAVDPAAITGFITNPPVINDLQQFEARWYIDPSITSCTVISESQTRTFDGQTVDIYGLTPGTSLTISSSPITSGPDTGKSLPRAYLSNLSASAGVATITIQCTNGPTTVTRTENLTIRPGVPPVITLTTAPSSIPKNGASTVIWNALYTPQCMASLGSGDQAALGSFQSAVFNTVKGSVKILNITKTTTFVIGCYAYGFGPLAYATTTLDVSGITLSASPTTVASGGASTLTWTIDSTLEQSCQATSNPSMPAWNNANLPVSNSNLSVSNITSTTDFTITCQKTVAAGGGTDSATATVVVGLPVVRNFYFAPTTTTAYRYGKKPATMAYSVTPGAQWVGISVVVSGSTKYLGVPGTLSASAPTQPYANASSLAWPINQFQAPQLIGGFYTNVFANYGLNVFTNGSFPVPTQKTTYTFTAYPAVAPGVNGTSASTNIDLYPANPVTIRQAQSWRGGVQSLPGNTPTNDINVNIFAAENGGYPSATPTAGFTFDAGPEVRECYIIRGNNLEFIFPNPAPTGNVYYPAVFAEAPDATSAAVAGVNTTSFFVNCLANDGTLLTSTNRVNFTYPPYATGVTASCSLVSNQPQLVINYTLPSGTTGAALRDYAYGNGGDYTTACNPTASPQSLPGGSLCETVSGAVGANSYTIPNNTPVVFPTNMVAPTHAAPLSNKKYNYWVHTYDQYDNWGFAAPYQPYFDSSRGVQCPAKPNNAPVATITTGAFPPPSVTLTSSPNLTAAPGSTVNLTWNVNFSKKTTDQITFTGYATDPDAGDTFTRFYWAYGNTKIFDSATSNTTINGNPGATITTTLPAGTYTSGNPATGLRFVVVDSNGVESAAAYMPTFTVVDVTGNNASCTGDITTPLVNGNPTDSTSAWINPTTKSIAGGTLGVRMPNLNPATPQTYRITCTDGVSAPFSSSVTLNTSFKVGDNRCEGNKGENVVNSPNDCKNAQFHEQIQ